MSKKPTANQIATKISDYLSTKFDTRITYSQVEKGLGTMLDAEVEKINDDDFKKKIEDFKRFAFFYEQDKSKGSKKSTNAGLESLERWYFDKLVKVFQNGSH